MVIRRKSDAQQEPKHCEYHQRMLHERANQETHLQRQFDDLDHDLLAECWCCCDDCTDLVWHHGGR